MPVERLLLALIDLVKSSYVEVEIGRLHGRGLGILVVIIVVCLLWRYR